MTDEEKGRESGPAATIYDIAKRVGVNPSTVSRALNRPGRVSAKLEREIREAADQLQYRANPIARALPTGRTRTIGLVAADITNPMIFDIIRGAERAAAAHDYTLILVESEESPRRELLVAERILKSVDCLILATTRLADGDIRSLASRKAVVMINRRLEGITAVVPDVDTGIAEMVDHLVGLGHRTVGYLAGPAQSWMSAQRAASLRRRAQWARLEIVDLGSEAPTIEGGRAAARRVRDTPATAVVAFNDLMAIGLIQELSVAGVSIPDELSIVGFDNIFGSDFVTPPLTTIASPLRQQGVLAVELGLGLTGVAPTTTGPTTGSTGSLSTHLIVRRSAMRPRSR